MTITLRAVPAPGSFRWFARDGDRRPRAGLLRWLFGSPDGILGGVLVDATSPIAMRDKVQHAGGGLLLARLAAGLGRLLEQREMIVTWRSAWTLAVVLAGAIAMEIFEVVRLRRWWASTAVWRDLGWVWDWERWTWLHTQAMPTTPRSPPAFADSFSWRDVLATVLGGITGA